MSPREHLVLHLESPLMSFGGVSVDERDVTRDFPTLSMMCGLLANALGYDHSESAKLERLQARLVFGARRDRPGTKLTDFQTVFLGQDFMQEAWTTHGKPAKRAGGSPTGTHIRRREYWVNSIVTVVLRLDPPHENPTLDDVVRALDFPARPLFLGRKPAIPSERLLTGRFHAAAIPEALKSAPTRVTPKPTGVLACWPQSEGVPDSPERANLVPLYDRRDWTNQIHVGRRLVWETRIELESQEEKV